MDTHRIYGRQAAELQQLFVFPGRASDGKTKRGCGYFRQRFCHGTVKQFNDVITAARNKLVSNADRAPDVLLQRDNRGGAFEERVISQGH